MTGRARTAARLAPGMAAAGMTARAAIASRAGGEADAIVGVVPGRVLEPDTLEQAAAAVALAARDGQRLAFVGGATELGLGNAPGRLDAVVRTGRLDRVVEHAPLDQIVTVECGVRFATLQGLLAAHGQMLALDPPWAERATVGGIVATSAFGARRTRYGSVRDLLIGLSFVRADGTPARAGGKVVKNVAGFDLPKLFTGSLGTLGLITTATFRLHPLPETEATVLFPGGDAADARRVVATMRAAQLEPDAAAMVLDRDGGALGVRFAGFERAVKQQRDRLVAAGRSLGLEVEPLDAGEGDRFWRRHRTAREAPSGFRAKVALLPASPATGELLARLREPLLDPRTVFYPTLGLGFVAGHVVGSSEGDHEAAEGDAEAQARAIAAVVGLVRIALQASGGSVVVQEAPAVLRAHLDVWGAAPVRHTALPLMRSLKARLDPEGRLAPGRHLGGI